MIRRRLGQVRRLGLFVLIPLVSALAPLVIVPMVSARYGPDGWAAVAVALGIGNAGLVVAEVGWGVVGPQRAARPGIDRAGLWERAHASRLVAVAAVLPVVVVVAVTVVPDHRGPAAFLAGALVLGALSPSWFFVGTGRPGLVLLCDTLPRVGALLLAAVSIALGASLWAYGAGVLVGAVAMLVLGPLFGRVRAVPGPAAFQEVPSVIREQAFLSLGRVVSTVYTALPATLLGFVAPGAIATFSASDRPMRMGFGILGAVPARLQSWIGSVEGALRRRRALAALGIISGVGVLAGTAFVLGMPFVAPVLFAGAVEVPIQLLLVSGVTVAVMCVSSGLGLGLVAADRASVIPRAIISAAVVGVPTVLVLGGTAGPVGAAIGVLAAELVGVAVQGLGLVAIRSQLSLQAVA